MPHLSLETSANLRLVDPAPLFVALHHLLAQTAGVSVGDCKSRWASLDDYLVGDGGQQGAFAHLTVRLFAGRSAAVREALAHQCLALLEAHLAGSHPGLALQISVELVEMDRSGYAKVVLPPG